MRNEAASPNGTSSAAERRLATILVADVFDYSRLMGEDEERTVQTLREYRAVLGDLLKLHKGRIFNTAGDATLAEFPSAVAAVRCATELQAALRRRNERLPDDQQVWFRIGINLGDVIVQGGDLLGDGVNVAARIQSIAEPGGVCISGSVYDQIQGQLTLQIRSLGEKKFKNIAQPIRTFTLSDDASRAPVSVRWRAARKGPLAAAGAGIVGLLAVGATGFWFYRDYGMRVAEETRRAEESKAAVASRLGPQGSITTVDAQKEAELLAELQSTKDALARVEASANNVEQNHLAAEREQRQAKLQADLKSAKDALQKAADGANKVEDRPAATVAAKNIETTAPKTAEPPLVRKVEGEGVDRFDGIYSGQMCMAHVDNTQRCIDVALNVQRGMLSAAWPSPWNTNPARAKGSISPDGAVELALSGFNARTGQPMPGRMSGIWADNTIRIAGAWAWSVPIPVSGTWTRSGDVAAAATSGAQVDKAVRFDGVYGGRMCSFGADGSPRCWDAPLTIQHGTLSAEWTSSYSSNLARAKGTISADGALDVALSGFNPSDGTPLAGKMMGSWADNKVTLAGNWANGAVINGTWTSTTGGEQGSGANRASVDDSVPDNDRIRHTGRGRRAQR